MRKRFLANRQVIFILLAILLSLCLALGAGFLSTDRALADEVPTHENEWEEEPALVRLVGNDKDTEYTTATGWNKGFLDNSYTVTAKAKYGNENTYIRVYDDRFDAIVFSQGTDKEAFCLTGDGLIPEYVIETLNELKGGEYYLLVVVPEGFVSDGGEIQYEYSGLNDGSPTESYVKANGVHFTITDLGIPSELELKIVEWAFKEYYSFINVIRINLEEPYLTQVEYSVYRDNNGSVGSPISGLTSFKTNADGEVDPASEAAKKLFSLSAGDYWLTATLTVDGKAISTTISFRVAKSENSWDVLPGAIQWTWGEFDANVNKINGKVSFEGRDMVYSVYNEDKTPLEGLEEFTVSSDGTIPSNIAKVLNTLDAGTYYIRCQSSTSNYDDINEYILVTVTQAQNIWEELPYLDYWSEGNFNANKNVFEGKSKYGNVKYTILNDRDKVLYTVYKEINGSLTVLNENGESVSVLLLNKLSAGSYKLVAEVEGTNNYTALKNSVGLEIADDAVALGFIIAATVVFAVIDVGAAAACITLLIMRRRKIEQQFKMMVHKELHGR